MIIAIDPGIRGAAAALRPDGRFFEVIDLPLRVVFDRPEISIPTMCAWLNSVGPRRIIIENVHSFPKEGAVGAFRFGAAVGMLRAIAEMVCSNTELVQPEVWKRYFDLLHAEKDESRQLARVLWPMHQTSTLSRRRDQHRAEAMLIAWWAARPPVGRNW